MGALISSKDGKIFGNILHSSLGQINNVENTLDMTGA
jgi:hypothetical protein